MGDVERTQLATDANPRRAVGLDVKIRSAITDAGLQKLPEERLACPRGSSFSVVDESDGVRRDM